MAYQYDFPSNISTNYNVLKNGIATLDSLLKEKNQEYSARFVVIIDDENDIKSLNVSFNICWIGGEYQISNTYTSVTAMSNSNLNTNFGNFRTSVLLPKWVEFVSVLINL